MIFTDPYFWGIIALIGLFGIAAALTARSVWDNRILIPLLLIIPSLAQTIMVLPFVEQARFAAGSWTWLVGGALILLGAYLYSSGILPLQWAEDPRSSVELKVLGVYRIVRHPIYLGDMLYSLGISLIFRSLVGLLFFPVWWIVYLLLAVIEEEILTDLIGTTYQAYTQKVKGRLLPRQPAFSLKETEIVRYPFKNLALKGGGVRGIAYAGALQVLEEEGILGQIERISGTSAGAITALVFSFRLHVEETISIFNTLNFSLVPQARKKEVRRPVIADELVCSQRLISDYGWYSSQYFYQWLQQIIADQCDGDGRATFADFKERGFRDLYIVAANLTRQQAEVFSAETTPDVAVADAVRMSMSIPLYFEALRFDGKNFSEDRGDYYVDGGVFDNFPIKYFDNERFIIDRSWYLGGVNWETLGCYLYIDDSCNPEKVEIRNVFTFMNRLMESYVLELRESYFDRDLSEQMRTIMISDHCIKPTQFEITVDSPEYELLIESGKTAAREFIANYRPIR